MHKTHLYGSSSSSSRSSRRSALSKIIGAPAAAMLVAATTPSSPVSARNLPESTGADLTRTGTIETLVPIVQIKNTLSTVHKNLITSDSVNTALSMDRLEQALSQLSASVPTTEQEFKRIFDQYSDPVSYKQKFMDQNAFLVYYTQGFDGPDRPPMESSTDAPERQTLQFGARNEAWVAWEELTAELRFSTKNPKDASSRDEFSNMLQATIKAVDSYLDLAPQDDVKEAMLRSER